LPELTDDSDENEYGNQEQLPMSRNACER